MNLEWNDKGLEGDDDRPSISFEIVGLGISGQVVQSTDYDQASGYRYPDKEYWELSLVFNDGGLEYEYEEPERIHVWSENDDEKELVETLKEMVIQRLLRDDKSPGFAFADSIHTRISKLIETEQEQLRLLQQVNTDQIPSRLSEVPYSNTEAKVVYANQIHPDSANWFVVVDVATTKGESAFALVYHFWSEESARKKLCSILPGLRDMIVDFREQLAATVAKAQMALRKFKKFKELAGNEI